MALRTAAVTRCSLTLGEVDGEVIRCGYHGGEFGANGACVRSRAGSDSPSGRIKSTPSSNRLCALDMDGDHSKADPAPDLSLYPWTIQVRMGWKEATP